MSSSYDDPGVRHDPAAKLCESRKFNGDPCQSRAKPGERFCHTHKFGPGKIDIRNGEPPFQATHVYLPHLEDAASIQSAISEVCELMLHRRIEPKEASSLFYAMQVASTNMALVTSKNKKLPPETNSPQSSDPEVPPPGTIHACEQPRRKKRRRA